MMMMAHTSDSAKRRQILDTAARLFATMPFHEVKLDTIASKARLGKGTIYLYFKSKEELYSALKLDCMDRLLTEIKGAGATPGLSAWDELDCIVAVLLDFARQNPHLYALIRAGMGVENQCHDEKRAEIAAVCERCIRRGVRSGEMTDPHPPLTAQYLLSFIRVALLYAPPDISAARLRKHMLQVVGQGIRKNPRNAATRAQSRTGR